jgi:hypothetical protein
MAWDAADEYITLPASTSVSLKQYQFVTVGSDGKLTNPTAGGRVIGVLVSSGTTPANVKNPVGTVQIVGVSKAYAKGSTLGVGDTVSASSVGYAKPSSASGYVIGYVVDGSSGSTGRVISVTLTR